MPKREQEVQTSPSPSLMTRIFGGITTPAVQQSWERMQREYPDRTNKVPHIAEMRPIQRFLNSGAYASTDPFGNIAINTNLINEEKADLDSVLAHELKHVEQVKNQGLLRSLYKNIIRGNELLEKEAYNEEEIRRKRRIGMGRDVNLPLAGSILQAK